jgi:hypothetical protein
VQGAAVLRDATNTYSSGALEAGSAAASHNPPQATGTSGGYGATHVSGGTGPADSLRKHRLLRLDAHQALLGPSESQLLITTLSVTLHALAVNTTRRVMAFTEVL